MLVVAVEVTPVPVAVVVDDVVVATGENVIVAVEVAPVPVVVVVVVDYAEVVGICVAAVVIVLVINLEKILFFKSLPSLFCLPMTFLWELGDQKLAILTETTT